MPRVPGAGGSSGGPAKHWAIAIQRRAVVLRHVVGMGISEIAEATGRPEGTVKADIHRGLERLRRVMEQET